LVPNPPIFIGGFVPHENATNAWQMTEEQQQQLFMSHLMQVWKPHNICGSVILLSGMQFD
jgi:hypothetical protein